MQQLQCNLATFVVHLAGHMAMQHCRDFVIHARAQRQQFATAIGRITTGNDDAHAAPGALGKIMCKFVDVIEAIFKAGVHRTHQHPIAQGSEAQIKRLQHMRIGRIHYSVLQWKQSQSTRS